jgi:DDE superfamily endonuclease
MGYAMDSASQQRMLDYFGLTIGTVLGNKKRRASFATYAMGLLGEGERKSMEPIAARAAAAPERVNAIHQQLGHFVNDSDWSDRAVRRAAARYGIEAMMVDDPISAYSGEADQPFRRKAITGSGACRSPDDGAGACYFAGFFPPVKPSAFRMESPPSLIRWALWTSRSQIASARVASPMIACQSFGST